MSEQTGGRVTDQQVFRLLAAIHPTRYEQFLKRLVTICFALAPNERGPLSTLGVWIDERWSDHIRRRGDRNAALFTTEQDTP